MALLSVEIPTYNEAGNIENLIDEIEGQNIDLEIIVIDDNSPDGTAAVVEKLQAKYPNLKLLVRKGKRGLASAVIDGLTLAESKYIAVMDGDRQHPPEMLYPMLEKVQNGNDLVIASRYVRGGNPGKLNAVRKVISRSATFIAHIILRETKNVKDPMSGFFVFRKSVVEGADINPSGYKILLEMLIKGNAENPVEVPYTFRPRVAGDSKLSLKEDLNYVHLVLKLAEYRPIKFLLVGLTGVLVNEGLLYLLHTHGLSVMYSGIISIESSILSNFALNNVWTFRSRPRGSLVERALKYNAVAMPGAIINGGVLNILSFLSVHYLVANIVGIALAFLANYLGSEFIVWPREKKKKKSKSMDMEMENEESVRS